MSSPSELLPEEQDSSLEPPPEKVARVQSNGAALANPHLSTMDDDFLYHIGYSRHEIREIFHDVKVPRNIDLYAVTYACFFHLQTAYACTCKMSIQCKNLVIHEMLRKTKQGNTTQQKDKATQHNSPKAVIFRIKISCLRWDSNPQLDSICVQGEALTN